MAEISVNYETIIYLFFHFHTRIDVCNKDKNSNLLFLFESLNVICMIPTCLRYESPRFLCPRWPEDV